MLAYDIALFIHMIGVIAMFSGFAIYQRAGLRLRSATDMDQVRSWLGLLESTNPMFASGSVLLLISGIYMMATRWRAPLPWIVVAVIGLLTISIVGATVSSRHLRRIRVALTEAHESVSGELALRIADAFAWSAVTAVNGLAIGIVFIMSTKPGWAASVGVAIATTALGAAIGARMGALSAAGGVPNAGNGFVTQPLVALRPFRVIFGTAWVVDFSDARSTTTWAYTAAARLSFSTPTGLGDARSLPLASLVTASRLSRPDRRKR